MRNFTFDWVPRLIHNEHRVRPSVLSPPLCDGEPDAFAYDSSVVADDCERGTRDENHTRASRVPLGERRCRFV